MIDILLSTYNGEKYLDELLESIIKQTYKDWHLIIRDDSSQDSTIDIISNYLCHYSDKIILVDMNSANLGCNRSFERLLSFVEGDYFMFCDQDDIWESNKIEKSIRKAKEFEELYGNNTPFLICGDSACIDENGNILHNSFFDNQKFIDTTDSFQHLMSLNVVQGATSLFNRACLSIINPVPKDVLYDYWMALCVSNSGFVYYIHEPLLLYRQHGENVLGAINIGTSYFVAKMSNIRRYLCFYRTCKNNFDKCPSFVMWIIRKAYYSAKRILR